MKPNPPVTEPKILPAKLVYNPRANGGKGAYTKNATEKDRAYGEHLKNSGTTGAEQFNKLVNSSHPVELSFVEGNGVGGAYHIGQTDLDYTVDENGVITVNKASTVIYEGAAENFVKDAKSGELSPEDFNKTQADNINTVKNNNLDQKDVITAIIGHEIEHAADPANIKILVGEITHKPIPNTDSEFIPQRKENNILHDLSTP
jgi:hypothetical protein